MAAPTRIYLREPFSGLSHLAGAGLATAGLVILLLQARGNPWLLVSFSIYGATLILLYLASAIYHLLPVGPGALQRLLKLDQCAIFLLIAGCYTPICVGGLRGAWGWSLLGVAWGLALTGVGMKVLWQRMPTWCDMTLYLAMGWLALVAAVPLYRALGADGLIWLTTAGVLFSFGSLFYITDRPRLWPGIFSAHEIWHLFVLAGSAAHFRVMVALIHPAR